MKMVTGNARCIATHVLTGASSRQVEEHRMYLVIQKANTWAYKGAAFVQWRNDRM